MNTIRMSAFFLTAPMLFLFLAPVAADDLESPEIRLPPRLVLQITVDQLRGDIPRRYRDRLCDGGFRCLMENCTVYLDAHHRHANTETIVGHTTLATGADPAAHGMVANVWLDRTTDELRYNVEDGSYPLATEGGGVDSSTEIDPTQRLARTDGRSPRSILVSTFCRKRNPGSADRSCGRDR